MSRPFARYAAVLLTMAAPPLVAPAGCNPFPPPACNSACEEGESAGFAFRCSPTDLTSVVVTGPCAGDAGALEAIVGGRFVGVGSATPGVCHVTFTFASGYVFSTDVTFAAQTESSDGCPPCPSFIGPTSGIIDVANPPSTCVAPAVAGGDGG